MSILPLSFTKIKFQCLTSDIKCEWQDWPSQCKLPQNRSLVPLVNGGLGSTDLKKQIKPWDSPMDQVDPGLFIVYIYSGDWTFEELHDLAKAFKRRKRVEDPRIMATISVSLF